MKLHSWCWFNVVFSVVIRRKEKEFQDAQNWQPGEIVQLSVGRLFPKKQEAGRTNVRSPWELQPVFISSLGRQAAWGVTSLHHFMAHHPGPGRKGQLLDCLCMFGLVVAPQLANFSVIKQKSCVYICAWWLCTHLCAYRPICVCIWIWIYIPIFIYPSRIDILWIIVFLI